VGVVAHAYTAQRGAEHGVVDGDDGLQADLGVVAEHHLLMTGGGKCFEQHGRAPLRVAHGFRPARRPSGDATNKKATLAGRRGERRGAILTPARRWPCEDGARGPGCTIERSCYFAGMDLPTPATGKGASTRSMLLGRACELAGKVGLEGVTIGELA